MRIAGRQQRIRLGVVERQLVEVEVEAARLLHQAQAGGDDVEVLKAQEVDLQKADVADRLHVVLGDHRLALRAELQRRVADERLGGDHDARGVRAHVARDALERPRHVDQPLLLLERLIRLAKLADLLQGVLERLGAALPDRHELGQPVGVAQRHLQHATDVADRRLGGHRGEGDDLSHPVCAVLLGDVLDHALAALDREVAVDVGHGHAVDVQESLEDQAVLEGVEVGDAEREGDQGAGGAAPAGPGGDAVLAGEVVEVPDDQEVGGVAGLGDYRQLRRGALLGRDRGIGAVAPLEAVLDEPGQVRIGRQAVGDVERRQQRRPELQLQVDHVGDVEGGGERVRHVGERRRHLIGCLEIVLLGRETPAVRVVEARPGLQAQQHVVRL